MKTPEITAFNMANDTVGNVAVLQQVAQVGEAVKNLSERVAEGNDFKNKVLELVVSSQEKIVTLVTQSQERQAKATAESQERQTKQITDSQERILEVLQKMMQSHTPREWTETVDKRGQETAAEVKRLNHNGRLDGMIDNWGYVWDFIRSAKPWLIALTVSLVIMLVAFSVAMGKEYNLPIFGG